MNNRYRYLIAYTHNDGALDRTEITSPVPIRSMADLTVVQQALRTKGQRPDAFILSFSLFTNQPGGGH